MCGSAAGGSQSVFDARHARRGVGLVLAIVVWLATMCMVLAFIHNQGGYTAAESIAHVQGGRVAVLAARSALAEASHVLRGNGRGAVLDRVTAGPESGLAHEPEAARAAFAPFSEGQVTIEPVQYRIVDRPKDPAEPFLIDLTVRATYAPASARKRFSRSVRRRHTGRLVTVTTTVGPRAGQIALQRLFLHGEPLVEVVEW